MIDSGTSQNEDTLVSAPPKRPRMRLSRWTALALAAVVAATVVVFVVASGAFDAGNAPSGGGTRGQRVRDVSRDGDASDPVVADAGERDAGVR